MLIFLTALIAMISKAPELRAQDSRRAFPVSISAYIEAYYAYDFDRPEQVRQDFLFNHNRHQSAQINLAYISAEVEQPLYRAKVSLQTGTYAMDNYAGEPVELRPILEAYAGLKLSQKRNFWLDVGVFESHIGFEYVESMKNPTLSRSLVAEHSPYFLAGGRMVYQPNEKLELLTVIANGWQRIQPLTGNSLPSFGTGIYYQAGPRLALSWNTLAGTDDPDDIRRWRYYNNFYAEWQAGEKGLLIAGFDIGIQQAARGSSSYERWYVPTLIYRQVLDEKWSTSLRMEYFHDARSVLIQTAYADGFRTAGYSLNVDYRPAPNVALRVEGRIFEGEDPYFREGRSRQNATLLASLAIALGR